MGGGWLRTTCPTGPKPLSRLVSKSNFFELVDAKDRSRRALASVPCTNLPRRGSSPARGSFSWHSRSATNTSLIA